MGGLDGRRLLVTRSADDATDWATTLAAAGAEPIVLPCITSEPIAEPAVGERLRRALGRAEWLVVTSRRGVAAFADLATPELPDGLSVAAVGESTAAEARDKLGRIDRVGPGTAAGLATDLAREPSIRAGARCLLVLAANAGDVLERTLQDAGATVERIDVYRTIPVAPSETRAKLSTLGCDTVLFASPTAVTGFANQVDVDIAPQMITIGPSTSAAVRAREWPVSAEAREPSLSGMIESVRETMND